jgi:ribonuclease Z
MKIPIYFLGTSQAIPTAKRNHTAMLLKYKQENILIDCGEGTQRQFRKMKINPCKLTRILISHWHGDHILGLPGLLQTLALNNYSKVLHIYGPKRTKKYLSLIFNLFVFVGKIKIQIHEITNNKVIETKDFIIKAYSLNHGTPCLGYRFEEKDKRRLDKKKLKKYNLPPSPLLQELQQGKNIAYKGKTIKAKDVSYIEKGKKIGFILDTTTNENCYNIAKNTDLLISESTYTEKESNLASEYKHLTAKQAAQIAKKSKAKKLILTHISQRYQKQESTVLKEAKSVFKPVILAEDLMKVEV